MKNIFFLSLLAAVTLSSFNSCTSVPEESKRIPTPYEKFILESAYPTVMEVYTDEKLMNTAKGNCHIYICLSQQRGRLYVGDRLAMDWPVSTGTYGHETPTGKFKINLKEPYHESGRYGKIYDAEGKCINGNADILEDAVPEGGKFSGSPMPNWMRLTYDGVGMHTGKVRAGRRLSHGCIRTPNATARRLYEVTKVGTVVTIVHEPEQIFPGRQALVDKVAAQKKAVEAAAGLAAEKRD